MSEVMGEVCARMRTDLSCFHFLSDQDVGVLGPYFTCRQAQASEVLWREGDPSDDVAFIVSGQVVIKKETEFPGRHVIVGIYGPGTIAGELCILTGRPRAVTAEAMTHCALLMLTRERFDTLAADHPGLALKLLKGMLFAVSTRLSAAFERLATVF